MILGPLDALLHASAGAYVILAAFLAIIAMAVYVVCTQPTGPRYDDE